VPFAPGLPDLNAVSAVCAAVTKPVNFMAGIKGKSFAVSELDAACEVKDRGQFGFLDHCLTTPELISLMRI